MWAGKKVRIKVDLGRTATQTSTQEVIVKEKRGLSPGKLSAIFSLVLEVRVAPIVHYIPDTTDDGLLRVKREEDQELMGLPMYLKVRLDRTESKREKGWYDIEIPDIPHPGGLHYPEARYAKIWFRVGHSGKRYIHTGEHSRGCITLLEQERWDELCKILVRARKDDGKSIGVLEVIV